MNSLNQSEKFVLSWMSLFIKTFNKFDSSGGAFSSAAWLDAT